MMRVLMVLPAGTLDEGHSGGASRYIQNFKLFIRLGVGLHVLRLGEEKQIAAFQAHESALNGFDQLIQAAASWEDVSYTLPPRQTSRIQILFQTLFDPVGFQYPARPYLRRAIQQSIDRINPDLLWLEGITLLAATGRIALPTVYSHTDLAYRVLAIRHAEISLRQRYFLEVHRRAEEKVTQMADHILTGSETDAQRMRDLGCPHVITIPTTYDPRSGPAPAAKADQSCLNVVHLGSLETTANRVGIMDYLQKAHQKATDLCAATGIPLKLWVIGDNRRVHPNLAALLPQDNIQLTGFLPDLTTVIRPFGIGILPYEHDSGYRTKLPLLLSLSQVIVATQAAVAGTQIDGLSDVCMIMDRVTDFPAALAHLAARPDERERLGRAAHRFFMTHFTHEAVLPQFQRFIQQVMGTST